MPSMIRMTNYFDWAARATRKREVVREDLAELPAFEFKAEEPMEVSEDPLSETGVLRFLRRIAGRDR